MKLLYLDVETTGLSHYKNDIIQLAFIIEIDGIVKEEKSFNMQPLSMENVEDSALKVNNITREQLLTFSYSKDIHNEVFNIFNKYINKYDKADKFTPCGYNVRFDLDFFHSWAKKCGNTYSGSYINWKYLDVMQLAYLLDYQGILNLPDYKLHTICEHFKIEFKEHDALEDIKATKQLFKLLLKYIH